MQRGLHGRSTRCGDDHVRGHEHVVSRALNDRGGNAGVAQLRERREQRVVERGRARGSGNGGYPGGLTDREVEVLRLVARGLTNKEVGVKLEISARTVGHHLAHAYEKIGVTTRAGAAMFAMKNGIVGAV